MGNFTASEILTVIVVILIVFGPNRLPELARKAGSLAASARRAMDSLKGEISAEYGDVIAPLRDARDELKSAGTELKGQVAEIGKEVGAAGDEIKGQVAEIGKEVGAAGDEIKDVTKQALDPVTGIDGASGSTADSSSESAAAAGPAEASLPVEGTASGGSKPAETEPAPGVDTNAETPSKPGGTEDD